MRFTAHVSFCSQKGLYIYREPSFNNAVYSISLAYCRCWLWWPKATRSRSFGYVSFIVFFVLVFGFGFFKTTSPYLEIEILSFHLSNTGNSHLKTWLSLWEMLYQQFQDNFSLSFYMAMQHPLHCVYANIGFFYKYF